MTYVMHKHGHAIRVHIEGTGDPLVVINGLTRPLESWNDFTKALPGRMVISFDAPGIGNSPTPYFPLSMNVLAEMVADILDKFGLPSADILGFSHGGAVAQQFAFQYPQRVKKLVLASTLYGVGSMPGNPIELFSLRAPGATPVGTLWRLIAISSWSSLPFLGRITAPTLVICGDRDHVAPPINSRFISRRIPGAVLIILPNTAHDLQQLCAVEFAGAVETFLSTGQ